eukprot:m.72865 g.72865  ORF g.72865 m.72865 type:complete len:546 (-) comp18760_c0_seq1:1051-2688(-)
MMTRTTLPAFAAVVGLHVLMATHRGPVLEFAPQWRAESYRPVLVVGEGCDAATPLWASRRTRALCVPPSAISVDVEVHRCVQTATGAGDGEDAATVPDPAFETGWPEMPLGATDGLRPEDGGQSRRLHRRHKRRRSRAPRVPDSDDEAPPTWRDMIASATLGLWVGLVLVHPPAAWTMWACVTAVTGVWMLAADRHFWRPVCAALSLNYWCAAAWIGCTVSPEVGAALAVVAIGVRGSALLFPQQCKGETKSGKRCSRTVADGHYCHQHVDQDRGGEAEGGAFGDETLVDVFANMSLLGGNKTRTRAMQCNDPCDHNNRGSLQKKLPCNQQHTRRESRTRGSGQIHDPEVREQVLKMNGGKCLMGRTYNPKCIVDITLSTLEVDHIHPWSKGGYDGHPNWGPICRSCNATKNNFAIAEACTAKDAGGLGGALIGGLRWLCSMPDSTFSGWENVEVVTDDDAFNSLVKGARKSLRIMVFSTECGACTREKPGFSESAGRTKAYRYIAVDCDRCPQLSRQLEIKHVPTYFEVRDGKFYRKGEGSMPF